MSRETSGRRHGNIQYWYYGCRKLHSGGRCPEPTKITGPNVDAHVEAAFLARLHADPVIAAAEPVDLPDGPLDDLAAAEAELVAYRDTELVSVLGADAYRQGLTERARVVDESRAALTRMRHGLPTPLAPISLIDEWPNLAREQRRAILAAAIDAVYVKRTHSGRRGTPVEDRVRVLFHGDSHDDITLPGTGTLAPYAF